MSESSSFIKRKKKLQKEHWKVVDMHKNLETAASEVKKKRL